MSLNPPPPLVQPSQPPVKEIIVSKDPLPLAPPPEVSAGAPEETLEGQPTKEEEPIINESPEPEDIAYVNDEGQLQEEKEVNKPLKKVKKRPPWRGSLPPPPPPKLPLAVPSLAKQGNPGSSQPELPGGPQWQKDQSAPTNANSVKASPSSLLGISPETGAPAPADPALLSQGSSPYGGLPPAWPSAGSMTGGSVWPYGGSLPAGAWPEVGAARELRSPRWSWATGGGGGGGGGDWTGGAASRNPGNGGLYAGYGGGFYPSYGGGGGAWPPGWPGWPSAPWLSQPVQASPKSPTSLNIGRGDLSEPEETLAEDAPPGAIGAPDYIAADSAAGGVADVQQKSPTLEAPLERPPSQLGDAAPETNNALPYAGAKLPLLSPATSGYEEANVPSLDAGEAAAPEVVALGRADDDVDEACDAVSRALKSLTGKGYRWALEVEKPGSKAKHSVSSNRFRRNEAIFERISTLPPYDRFRQDRKPTDKFDIPEDLEKEIAKKEEESKISSAGANRMIRSKIDPLPPPSKVAAAPGQELASGKSLYPRIRKKLRKVLKRRKRRKKNQAKKVKQMLKLLPQKLKKSLRTLLRPKKVKESSPNFTEGKREWKPLNRMITRRRRKNNETLNRDKKILVVNLANSSALVEDDPKKANSSQKSLKERIFFPEVTTMSSLPKTAILIVETGTTTPATSGKAKSLQSREGQDELNSDQDEEGSEELHGHDEVSQEEEAGGGGEADDDGKSEEVEYDEGLVEPDEDEELERVHGEEEDSPEEDVVDDDDEEEEPSDDSKDHIRRKKGSGEKKAKVNLPIDFGVGTSKEKLDRGSQEDGSDREVAGGGGWTSARPPGTLECCTQTKGI
jgi:hypothetical protein